MLFAMVLAARLVPFGVLALASSGSTWLRRTATGSATGSSTCSSTPVPEPAAPGRCWPRPRSCSWSACGCCCGWTGRLRGWSGRWLDLAPTDDDNRRVLAVLAYLDS